MVEKCREVHWWPHCLHTTWLQEAQLLQMQCIMWREPSEVLQWRTPVLRLSRASIQFRCSVVSNSLWPHGLQHASFPSITNSRSLLRLMSIEWLEPFNWLILCHPSSCHLQSFPASVQFSSVTQSCLTLCDPMNCSMPGLPVHHQLLESTQTHVHWVSDAIQTSHPLWSPSPPAINLSQHQGLFKWVSS